MENQITFEQIIGEQAVAIRLAQARIQELERELAEHRTKSVDIDRQDLEELAARNGEA